MATIRELQASFIARANGLKSTIQGVKREIDGLAKHTKKSSEQMINPFQSLDRRSKDIAKSIQKVSSAAEKSFESVGNVINSTSKTLGTWSKDIKQFGKSTSAALSPLTAFYTAAAIGGGKRMIANEQLDILMRNVFRTEESYERAWESIRGLTKGTAFMNSDTGQWLSQLVQSNVELDKSTEIMKSIYDFSVGSGQLGMEGEIHDIIMKAVRAEGWDQMTLDMMAQRGLNLAGHVANVLGVSTKEAQEMLKSGEISMEESLDYFVDAVQVGSEGAGGYFAKMADSAQKGGETMTGAWINTKAALAQLGQNMWESGAWDELKNALNSLYEFLYELSPALEPMAKIIASIMATAVDWLQKLMTAFINLRPKTQALIASLSVIGAVLGPAIYFFGLFVGAISKALKPLGFLFTGLGKVFGIVGKVAGAFGKGGLQGVIVAVGKKLPWLARLFTVLTGPIGIVIGVITALATAFVVAYKRSEKFRKFIDELGEKLKELFFGIADWIRPGFDAVLSFFGEIKTKITEFINQDGAQLMDAFKNIGFVIGTVAKAIWSAVKWTFEQMKWIIADYVMPIVEFIIRQVWGNIKGIITGTLDVIMGAVKIFSGLFTGDFSKMWEGVKQLFFGAIKVIWNWIELQFIGKILKGVGGFVKGFWGHIKNLWKWVKDTFTSSITSVYQGVKNSFVGRIITAIINFVKNFKSNVTDLWTNVKSIFSSYIATIFNSIKNSFVGRIIKSIVGFAKNFRQNISKMWDLVKSNFSSKISDIRSSIENSFVARIIKSITGMKTKFVGIAKDMWKGVKEQFDNIVDGAKKLPGRIGKGIENAKDKAVDGMKSLGKGVLNAAAKPINGTIDGINWILKKVKAPTIDGQWKVPTYSKGTQSTGHKGGLAVVGDKYGREIINLPNGQSFISPDTDTLMNLPKGTHVIPNRETEKILDGDIPMYAKGTKGWKSKLSKIWDYIKKPIEVVKTMMNGIKIGDESKGVARKVAVGTLNYLKDKPVEFIKGIFKKQEESEHNPNVAGKPAFKWPVTSHFGYRMHPIHKTLRLHAGTDFGAPTGAPIPSQTTGTVNYAGRMGGFGNLVRVKSGIWEMYYAHLSKILTKVGQTIKKGEILGLVGSTGDSTGPHLHYETRKNGKPVNPLSLKGYADGGIINHKQLAWIAEGGWAESIISHDPSKRVRQRAIWKETGDRLGFTDDKYSKDILEKLERIAKAVEEGHGHDIIVNDRVVGEMVEETVTEKQNRRKSPRRKRRSFS